MFNQGDLNESFGELILILKGHRNDGRNKLKLILQQLDQLLNSKSKVKAVHPLFELLQRTASLYQLQG